MLFAIVGGIAFFVDAGILYLVKGELGIYRGRLASFFCAVLTTWILNRLLTFRHRSSGLSLFSEFARYMTVMLAGGAVNYLVYALLAYSVEMVAAQPIWGVAAGSLSGMLFNFFSARHFVFKKNTHSPQNSLFSRFKKRVYLLCQYPLNKTVLQYLLMVFVIILILLSVSDSVSQVIGKDHSQTISPENGSMVKW
jgi:putative flippase GtrA